LAIPALSLKERKYTLRDGVYYFEKSGRIPKAIEYLGYES